MIDRVAAGLGKPMVEVPVGLQVVRARPARRLVRLRRRGVGRRVVPAHRRHRVDHRQGRDHPRAARLRDPRAAPGSRRASTTGRWWPSTATRRTPGSTHPADRAQKAKLAALSPDDVTATELAGEPITARLTEAPGNGARIGGLKVTTESAWFAARPSGTEDVYKIYAESFRGPDHLAQVQDRGARGRVGGAGMSHPAAALLDDAAATGREPGGAVCVIRDGEVVVDHVVGTRDGSEPWTPDTLVMTYSVAKPFAALTVLDVVAAGGLGLDQPVTDVWPEYAAHGKGATTVRHVLHHSAGLPTFPDAAADLAFDDLAGLTALLADAAAVVRARDRRRRARPHLRPPLRRPGPPGHRRRPRRPVRRASPPPTAGTCTSGSPRRTSAACADVVALDGWPGRLRDRPALGTGARRAARAARPGRPQLRALPPLQLPRRSRCTPAPAAWPASTPT